MKRFSIWLPVPHDAQRAILMSKARWRVVRAGRRFGKSLVAQNVGINKMLQAQRVAYIAPTFKMCKKFFRGFVAKLPKALVAEVNKTDLTIRLIGGGLIQFFSGEAIDSIRGDKFHFVIVDEAAFIKDFETAWTQAIRPTLTDYEGGALFISTPRGMNYFYALCSRGSDPNETDYEEFYFTSYDNPHIKAAEIEKAKDELPEDVFNQEYMAIASENAANPFQLKYINAGLSKELSTKPPVCIGIDVAKIGDYTVFFGVDEDRRLCFFERFRAPWPEVRRRIAELPAEVLKVMDATGAGNPIFEELLYTEGVQNLTGHVFTNQSKVQMVYEFVMDVQKSTISYNDVTAAEMTTYEYNYNAVTGVLRFAAQSGFHDDCISAAMLCNHYSKQYAMYGNWRVHAA